MLALHVGYSPESLEHNSEDREYVCHTDKWKTWVGEFESLPVGGR